MSLNLCAPFLTYYASNGRGFRRRVADPSYRMRPRPASRRANQQPLTALLQSLQKAAELYNASDFPRAEQLCRSILQLHADQFDALNIMGSIASQTRRPQEAAQLLARAV